MMSRARPRGRVSGRLRLAVAGAVMLTALERGHRRGNATSADLNPPATRPDPDAASTAAIRARLADNTGPCSPFPAFLLDRGRYTAFEAPDPGVQLIPLGINNRGLIVGE